MNWTVVMRRGELVDSIDGAYLVNGMLSETCLQNLEIVNVLILLNGIKFDLVHLYIP